MKYFSYLILMFLMSSAFAQPNCSAYKYDGDFLKYEACLKSKETKDYYQFSKDYQRILDESISIDSTFAYAYWAKSIAYLKSGDFVTWKKLIDKAVQFDPESYLGYRGWCRYQFFRDYQGAIKDIEKLDILVDYDIGQSQNGTYHLNIARGLCYKAIGKIEKSIKIIKSQIELNKKENFIGLYDYLHLGVLYFEKEEFRKALKSFKNQSKVNELAENQYYAALTYKKLNMTNKYVTSIQKAKELYIDGIKMYDPYSNPMDKIFLENIENTMSFK